jgi:subtilisin family serine protease
VDATGLVGLTPLMAMTSGSPDITIALIDGPVNLDHPDFAAGHFRELPGTSMVCLRSDSAACMHGTLVAGILAARRGSPAPAICPDCTLMIRPIFAENPAHGRQSSSATPEELATAVIDVIDAGAHIVNLSVGVLHPTPAGIARLLDALDYATRRNVLCVAAAGNQGEVGGSTLTSHPWVIPAAACDTDGRLLPGSNLGRSIGRNGVLAPGANITSLGPAGTTAAFSGTSAAAAFVTGTLALLWSLAPAARAINLRLALTNTMAASRRSVIPPLLDAWGAYQRLTVRSNQRLAS